MASTPTGSHPDSFGARTTLTVGSRDYDIFSLTAPTLGP